MLNQALFRSSTPKVTSPGDRLRILAAGSGEDGDDDDRGRTDQGWHQDHVEDRCRRRIVEAGDALGTLIGSTVAQPGGELDGERSSRQQPRRMVPTTAAARSCAPRTKRAPRTKPKRPAATMTLAVIGPTPGGW
jgi:hypothetical protein